MPEWLHCATFYSISICQDELQKLKQDTQQEHEKMDYRFQADAHTIKRLEEDRIALIEQVASLTADKDLRAQLAYVLLHSMCAAALAHDIVHRTDSTTSHYIVLYTSVS